MQDLQQQILSDLQTLGVRSGGVLLVHSSLRSLGAFPDRAELLISALQEAVGAEGTLLMPALSYETVTAENPYFDVETTPSCVGALSEIFRKRPDVLRSAHPTHSVCGRGRLAEELLGAHHRDTTPCGPNSPFYQLKQQRGQILFIGCGLRPNTSMHAVEELVEPPYLFGNYADFYLRLPGGRQTTMRMRRHYFVDWEQRYDRLANILAPPALKKGHILAASCRLVEAAEMWVKTEETLRKDPLYFVDRIG